MARGVKLKPPKPPKRHGAAGPEQWEERRQSGHLPQPDDYRVLFYAIRHVIGVGPEGGAPCRIASKHHSLQGQPAIGTRGRVGSDCLAIRTRDVSADGVVVEATPYPQRHRRHAQQERED
jgi:hypothetical protein